MAELTPANSLPSVTGLDWRGVRYFSTVRQGGVSTGPCASLNLGRHTQDNIDHVVENRRRLRAELPAEPFWLNQVHGVEVADADLPADVPPSADAAVTAQKDRVLVIMTADCLPVVIADDEGSVLGVAHAGWRGLLNGVLEETLRRLQAKRPQTSRWRAWIGPGISQRHFEVGADVQAAFVDRDRRSADFFVEKIAHEKWLADLPGLARFRLQEAGVGQVELSGYCTFGEAERFYSYRRERDTGRLATVAWLPEGR
ncbi:peptidoglycan editing factor PgeF [Paralcaligenes sp. KSB-10]|uniref:peptidoglycan editing factor PgeF n=1 Tax=Paralcaligenes sp. KSB-10 TaxID=2901142 RepID=UPI001E58FF2D|nr:peptidoglycan editing factor PgeF [Paralcaligenes sp. KSB-10]UHL65966.1 peptidoglycan editing factor PgeF [Paralcaligenes sp. KSB-10]